MVVDGPGDGSKGDLQEGVAVQQDDDSDKETKRESMMRRRLMRLIKRMRIREFLLMVLQSLHLFRVQDAVLSLLFRDLDVFGLLGGQVVVVFELGEGLFAAQAPG